MQPTQRSLSTKAGLQNKARCLSAPVVNIYYNTYNTLLLSRVYTQKQAAGDLEGGASTRPRRRQDYQRADAIKRANPASWEACEPLWGLQLPGYRRWGRPPGTGQSRGGGPRWGRRGAGLRSLFFDTN